MLTRPLEMKTDKEDTDYFVKNLYHRILREVYLSSTNLNDQV